MYNFSAAMASTYSTYHLGAVASLIYSVIENMPQIMVQFSIID